MKFLFPNFIFSITLCIALIHSLIIYGMMPNSPAYPQYDMGINSSQNKNVGMPDFSPEDLEILNELISNLTPEEIEAYAKKGEEIIKQAEELGIDPWEYAMMIDEENNKNPQEYPPVVIPHTAPSEVKETPKTDISPESNEKLIANIQKQIQDFIKVLNAIADNLLENNILKKKFDQYCKYTIADFTFHLQLLAKDAVIKSLMLSSDAHKNKTPYKDSNELSANDIPEESTAQKFDNFISSLSTFYLPLSALEKDFDIAAFDIAGKTCSLYDNKSTNERAKKRKNEQILDQIITLIQANKNLLTPLKEFVKIYEPEAVKLKAESDRLEAEARKTQEDALKNWIPANDYQNNYWPDYNASHTGTYERGYPSYGNDYNSTYNNSGTRPAYTPPSNYGSNNNAASSSTPSPSKNPEEATKPDAGKGRDSKQADKKDQGKDAKDKDEKKSKPAPDTDGNIDIILKTHAIQSKFDEIELIVRDGIALIDSFPEYLTQPYDTDDFDIIKRQTILESLGKAFDTITNAVTKQMNNKDFKNNARIRDQYTKDVEKSVNQFKHSREFKQLEAKLIKPIIIDTTTTPITRTVESVPGTITNINDDKAYIYFGDPQALLRSFSGGITVRSLGGVTINRSDITSRNVPKLVGPGVKKPTNFYEIFRIHYDNYIKTIDKLLLKP